MLWGREVRDSHGRRLGRIEAVGWGPDGELRSIGVKAGRRPLVFARWDEVTDDGTRIVLSSVNPGQRLGLLDE